MSDETKPVLTAEQLLKSIGETVGSDEKAAALINYLLSLKKPTPQATYYNKMPYYKEIYGREMFGIVTKMLEAKKDMKWDMADFPDYRKRTLHQRLSQGLLYMFEELPEGKELAQYKEMLQFDVKSHPDRLYLRWLKDKLTKLDVSCTLVDDNEEFQESLDGEIEEFLNSEKSGRKFYKTGLVLDNAEIERLEMAYGNIVGINFLVTKSEIKIIKDLKEDKPE